MSRLLLVLVVLLGGSALAADGGARRRSVAILYFDVNGAADADVMVFRKGLAEMMTVDLAEADVVDVVERTRLEEVLAELDLQNSAKVDKATAQKLGKLIGADYLVFGSLQRFPGSGTVITMRLDRPELGKIIGQGKVKVKDDDVLEAEGALVQKLIVALAEAEQKLPPEPKKEKRGRLPYKTAVKYAQAVDARDRKDVKAAKQKLTEVLEEQPEFALAKVDLLSLMNQ